MAKPNIQSVKAELDTLAALSQERFIELLNQSCKFDQQIYSSRRSTKSRFTQKEK